MVHGRVNTSGSSIVASYSRWSGPVGVYRSTTCRAVLWKLPARSNHVSSLKWITSTTRVSPSHRPRESPIQKSMCPSGCDVPSMYTVRVAWTYS